jgi:hypothetical protein
MGKNPRVRIGLRELAAQPPGPFVLWGGGDGSVKGFCARRQFSNVITYSVIYRTKEGQQRWFKFGHHRVGPLRKRERGRTRYASLLATAKTQPPRSLPLQFIVHGGMVRDFGRRSWSVGLQDRFPPVSSP